MSRSLGTRLGRILLLIPYAIRHPGVTVSELSERFGTHVREAPLLTRERHREAVNAARAELAAFGEAWGKNHPPSSVAAVHLREAAHYLGELIGSIDVEDVLGRVFSKFCVGK